MYSKAVKGQEAMQVLSLPTHEMAQSGLLLFCSRTLWTAQTPGLPYRPYRELLSEYMEAKRKTRGATSGCPIKSSLYRRSCLRLPIELGCIHVEMLVLHHGAKWCSRMLFCIKLALVRLSTTDRGRSCGWQPSHNASGSPWILYGRL